MNRVDFPSNGSDLAIEAKLQLPERLDERGLLVGWSMEYEHVKYPMGFNFGDPRQTPASGYIDPILMIEEGHLLTIAPTGAGKGVGCIIPALLKHDGPAIIIDPKGENAAVTSRRRKEMGQTVIVLDPIGVSGLPSGSMNPLDLIEPENASGVDDAAALASVLLPAEMSGDKNLFWVSRARQLLTAVLLYVATDLPEQERTLSRVRNVINDLAVSPDEYEAAFNESRHPEVRAIYGNLRISARETLGAIISFAQEGVDFMRGPAVQAATAASSFSLDDVTKGSDLTIYVVIPPHMLESHGRLLRLWISTLFIAVTRRRRRPDKSTLFLLDEAAQLGALPQLRQALTLLRGYGLQTWSFWQDVSQLKALYPVDWETMVNNCSVIQTFGARNANAARAMAELVGFPGPRVLDLDESEMILQIAGDDAVVAKRPTYLTDPAFSGLFDQNPLFDAALDPSPVPRMMREYLRPRTPKGHLIFREFETSRRPEDHFSPNGVDRLVVDEIFRALEADAAT